MRTTLLTCLILTVVVAASAAHASSPGGIDGYLYEPDGTTPVAFGWIDIHDDQGVPWMGTDTAADGYFSIANLSPNFYHLVAYPPSGSAHSPSLSLMVDVLAGFWSTTSLYLTETNLSGWVQDAGNGARIGDAPVVVHDDTWSVELWTTTDTSGEYKFGGLQNGTTYTLEVFGPAGSDFVQLPIHYQATPPATGVVLEMQAQPVNVVGIVTDPGGTPLPGAHVSIYTDGHARETESDAGGAFLFRGMPVGDYLLHASPPWGAAGLIASDPIPVSLPLLDSFVDVGPVELRDAAKTVSGTVTLAGTSTGVDGAIVWGQRLDGSGFTETPTNPDGTYTLSLTGGEWLVGVAPLVPPVPWIFTDPPPETLFVVCSGDPPPEAIRVELRNDQLQNHGPLDGGYGFVVPIITGWYELVVHLEHPDAQAPAPTSVFVGPGQSLDAGDLELLPKDAVISGRVYNDLGSGVADIPIVAVQAGGIGRDYAVTDPSGDYTLHVVGGQWHVEPLPTPEQDYVFKQARAVVNVAASGTVTGVDFTLTTAEARIAGMTVDIGSGLQTLGLEGTARALRFLTPPGGPVEPFSTAPIREGAFELKVAGGHDYRIAIDLPHHAPYLSTSFEPLLVPPTATVPLEVPLTPKDAVIEGILEDATTGSPPAGPVAAEVFGEDGLGNWVSTPVDPSTASYALDVAAGTWTLRVDVDPSSGYAGPTMPAQVAVSSGQTVPLDFPIWPINSIISGTVMEPDGATPVSNAAVHVDGQSPHVGYFQAQTTTDAGGNYALIVPEGDYTVSAALPAALLSTLGWLNPTPIPGVVVTAASPVTGLQLDFRGLDGTISGVVSFAAGLSVSPTQSAYVWGWSEDGEWAEAEATIVTGTDTFTYELDVVMNSVWHVGAIYEDLANSQYYESTEAVVLVPSPGGLATQNLELQGPYWMPQPFIVSFDGTQMQTIIMPDGVELVIPAGAMVTSGTVTLFIFPKQALRPEADSACIGAGYEIFAVDQNGVMITQFYKKVLLTFDYPADSVLAQQGIDETRLVPVYYSTLFGNWVLASSYVVDTANNEVTVQLDHFTSFCVAAQTPDTDGDGVVDSIDTDDDNDGVADALDCMPLDEIAWTPPSVADRLVLSKATVHNLTWFAPMEPGAVSLWFDVLMSFQAHDFSSALCVETDELDLMATDAPDPAPGQLFHYLVRVENPCGSTMGLATGGVPRGGGSCP